MVDPRVYIPGIVDTGKVLTFTPEEAMKTVIAKVSETVAEVLAKTGYENARIEEYKPSWIEKIIGFLVHPVISGLLIMAIVGGIYFEMQTPGIGFPLGVAILGALLYFAPHYLEGLAEHWEILLFIAGLILLGVEIFVTPGFGVAGIAGIALVFLGLVLSLLHNVKFNFEGVNLRNAGIAVFTVFSGVSLGMGLSLYLGDKLFGARRGPFGKLALQKVQEVSEGYVSIDNSLLLLNGQTGFAKTVLRPSGKVEIGGEVYDAVTSGEFIEKGATVTVIRIEATQLYVEKA